MPHLVDQITQAVQSWRIKPQIVLGEEAKWAAFRSARLALAASGTVTLELALSAIPMVVAYKYSRLEGLVRPFVHVPSIVLANLVLERNACREFLQDECTPQTLATALGELIVNGPARTAQEQAWSDLRQIMHVGDQESPSSKAAKIVLASLSKR